MAPIIKAAKIAVSRKPSVLRNLRRTEQVSGAAHSVDHGLGERPVHLCSNTAHMRFHDIGARIEMELPHIFEEHGSRDHLASMPCEIFQNPKLLRLEL